MKLKTILSVITTLFMVVLSVCSRQYDGCLGGSTSQCCSSEQYNLYAGDSLALRSTAYFGYVDGQWCEKKVLARERRDSCSGCTLTIQFRSSSGSSTRLPAGSRLTIYEGNYTSNSYYFPENVLLRALAVYDGNNQPYHQITTSGNLLNIVIEPHQGISVHLLITPNFPGAIAEGSYATVGRGRAGYRSTTNYPYTYYTSPYEDNNYDSDTGLALTLGITIPLSVVVALFCGCLKYQIRKRQAQRLRDQVNRAIVAAAVRQTIADQRNRAVRAVITTAVLERLNEESQQRQSPHSPDPIDFISPPAYSEALPPPSYSDVVAETAGPDVESLAVAQPPVSHEPGNEISAQEQVSADMEQQVPCRDSDVEMEDSAGPDTGNDVDRLII